jgi:hypothetical protein
MSRATAVRDAIIAAIKENLAGDQNVEPFSLLLYEKEELADKPLILARVAGREFVAEQGPDTQMVMIDVIVCAKITQKTSSTYSQYRQELVANYDAFDNLFESLIALWVPNGPLSQKGMADHRFSSIEEIVGFEMDELYSDGVYLSWIQLKYQDCLDEGEED